MKQCFCSSLLSLRKVFYSEEGRGAAAESWETFECGCDEVLVPRYSRDLSVAVMKCLVPGYCRDLSVVVTKCKFQGTVEI